MAPTQVRRKLLVSAFPMLFAATFAVSCYMVTTTSIVAVPRDFPFGIIKIMPIQYWFALGSSLALFFAATLTQDKKCLWMAAILLVALVAGLSDLIYAYPRDLSTATAAGAISRKGFFASADNPYLNFPGSAILFSFLLIVTGTSPFQVIKAFGVVYNTILLVFCFACFQRLGFKQTHAILAALVVIFSFYMQGALIHSSLIGFIFYTAIFWLALSPYPNRATNIFILTTFFLAVVIYHAFTPFAIVGAVGVMLFGWQLADRMIRKIGLVRLQGCPPSMNRSIVISLLAILVAYWSYIASAPFSWALRWLVTSDLLRTLHLFLSTALIGFAGTLYSGGYASVARLYAPILSLGFAVYLYSSTDKRKLQLLLWLLGLACLVIITVSGYVYEFFARVFAFSILPLVYGIAKLFDSNRRLLRGVGLVILIVTIGLHLPTHYGQDSFQVLQDSTVKALQFYVTQAPFDASFGSSEQQYVYYVETLRSDNTRDSTGGSYFLMNYQAGSWILYLKGEEHLDTVSQELDSSQYNALYSNGWSNIYLQNEP